MSKVVKFGGSSLASAEQFKKDVDNEVTKTCVFGTGKLETQLGSGFKASYTCNRSLHGLISHRCRQRLCGYYSTVVIGGKRLKHRCKHERQVQYEPY